MEARESEARERTLRRVRDSVKERSPVSRWTVRRMKTRMSWISLSREAASVRISRSACSVAWNARE